MTSKPDFSTMDSAELQAYILEHREEEEDAVHAYLDRLYAENSGSRIYQNEENMIEDFTAYIENRKIQDLNQFSSNKYLEELNNEIERIFTILEKELKFSEKNNLDEKIISFIKKFDKIIPYDLIANNTVKLSFINMVLLISMFYHFMNIYGKYTKSKMSIPTEIIPKGYLELIILLVLFCFVPILLLINLIAVMLLAQVSTEDMLRNIKRRKDYFLDYDFLSKEWLLANSDRINFPSKNIHFLVLDSLKSHFEYLLKREEKNKDRSNSFIPIIAAIVILIAYRIGIPKEIIDALKRPSEYESIAILTGFLIVFYGAIVQYSYARFSIKYLKCISTIEKLKSLNT